MSARAWQYRRVCKHAGHLLTWDGFYLRGRACKRCYRCNRKIVRTQASITCPKCGSTSRHPWDVREGYCGFCHDWTSPRLEERQITNHVTRADAEWLVKR